MQFAAPVIDKVEQLSQEFNLPTRIGFKLRQTKISPCVCYRWAEIKQQLASNLSAWKSDKSSLVTRIDEIFSEVDERIINQPYGPIEL